MCACPSAFAGTHNHRCGLLSEIHPPSYQDNNRRGVWVPARAYAWPGRRKQFSDSIFKQQQLRVRDLAAHYAQGLQKFFPLEHRGRREDRVRAAPAVSCANCTRKCAHEHTGSAETLRPSPRNGFTAYSALSPVTGFVATVAPEKRLLLKELSASIGAPEPHDFAVRVTRRSSKAHPRPPHPTARS